MKPRLCELLGVDVDERFSVRDKEDMGDYYVDKHGEIQGEVYDYIEDCYEILVTVINNPNTIIKRSWSCSDIQNAEAIKSLWSNASYISRHRNGKENWLNVHRDNGAVIGEIDEADRLFLSLKYGATALIDDIINSGGNR